MADKSKIVPGNCAGDFFVDTSCINCGNCRDLAPEIFGRFGTYAGVKHQPQTSDEINRALASLVCCPTGSIGTHEKHDLKAVIDQFPQNLDGPVYYLGFNSKEGAGGKSYFVKDPGGNWMIDSPKFQPRLVKWMEENGGLKYIFLTHRDDVGEAAQYAKQFSAQRIIHINDKEAQPDAEIQLEGIAETSLQPGFLIIPTPGHTEGHCMLLCHNNYLFSGDVFTSQTNYQEDLEAWPPFYCWWSWTEQTKSLQRLANYDFEWFFPAHGRRFHSNRATMKTALKVCIERCLKETDPNPHSPERIDFFEHLASFADSHNQPLYAATMRQRADKLRQES